MHPGWTVDELPSGEVVAEALDGEDDALLQFHASAAPSDPGEPPESEEHTESPAAALNGHQGHERPLSAERAYQPYREVAGDSWTDPVDLATKAYAGLPLPMECIPAGLRQAIKDFAFRSGIDRGIVFQGMIVATAGVADDQHRVMPMRNDAIYTERPCVWTLAIGGPSTGKTPGLLAGIREAEAIDRAHVVENVRRMKDYQHYLEGYEMKRRDAAKNSLPRPPQDDPPPQEEILLNNGTMEGVRAMLQNCPRGILWFRDEWGGMIGSLDKYGQGSGERDDVLELYNGGQQKTGRVGGRIVVPNWSACLSGGVTPSKLREFAGPGKLQDDGLLQRFLICMATNQRPENDVQPDFAALEQYRAIIRNLHEMPVLGAPVSLSADASEVRRAFLRYVDALKTDDSLPAPMLSHLGKWPGLFARLCLLYHLIELASHDQLPNDHEQISGDTAQQVSNLLLIWQYSHLEEFWLDMMGSGRAAVFSQSIANFILSKHIDRLEFRTHIVRPHFLAWEALSPHEQAQAMSRLENAGWLRADDGARMSKKGFPSAWHVNPAVHHKFKLQAKEMTSARSEMRAKLQEIRAAKRAAE